MPVVPVAVGCVVGDVLPVSVAPQPGESLESWLEHLAEANGLPTARLLAIIGTNPGITRYLSLAPSPDAVARLSLISRVDPDVIRSTALATFDGTALNLSGLEHSDRHSYRHVAAKGWVPAHGTQLCPTCLAETGAWRTSWRLLIVTTCTRHSTLLVTTCPGCRRPFRDQRQTRLRRVGAVTLCGNPLGSGPNHQCQQDLTTIPTTAAPTSALGMQARVDAALVGEPVTVFGEHVSGQEYLSDLRYLTTLLLHLAGQPGAHHVADWAFSLRRETAQRTGARGPRWGLRPPDLPGLRSSALTAADRILNAATLPDAVDAVTPWVNLTPVTTDGPCNWLTDRTVVTPNLDRLILAALADRRRLSHHLDHDIPRGGSMTINLKVIPQVMPREAYANHLEGALGNREDTVRLFASLTLARRHPDVITWAGAARVLGMPPTIGTATARACSARMETTPEDWSQRAYAAIVEMTPINYRDLEAKITHRSSMYRWFDEWVSGYRPGTSYKTRDYGITWQWTHIAHGHLKTSPAWQHTPQTARSRADYRAFEASLSEEQQRSLTHALYKRA